MRLKAALTILLFTALISCKSNIDPQQLRGTWKPANESGLGNYGVIAFLENDSIIAKTFDYGRLSSEISGRYKFDPKTSTLTTSYGDSITYELEVRSLSKIKLELYYLKTKQLQQYVRAD